MLWENLKQLASNVQNGDTTSVALVRAALSRISKVDKEGGINSVVVLDSERALIRAAEIDELSLADKERLPLVGVPITVKEHINVAGLPSTAGDPTVSLDPVLTSAPVVLALEAAGAIVIGKTNVPLNLADYQSYNAVYGRTNNPHNLSLSPGGSSGGSSAAVAAGLVPVCIGTDIGGSVRVPAHCCGVFAHKPSWGIISKSNGGDPAPPKALSTTGPISRCAGDLTIVSEILFANARDQFSGLANSILPSARIETLKGCRVALWDNDRICPVDKSVTSAIRATVKVLEDAGAIVTLAKPEVDSEELLQCYRNCVNYATESQHPNTMEPVKSYAEFIQHTQTQCKIRAAFAKLFSLYDVLLTPTFPVVAFPHDDIPADRPFFRDSPRILPNGLSYYLGCFWPALANVTSLPATAFPVQGETEESLPVALQMLGRELDDLTCLKVTELLEEAGKGTRVAQFQIPVRLR